MNAIIYVRDNSDIPIYKQSNEAAQYCKHHGYSISDKVLDFDGKQFHEAVNKLIADSSIKILMIYNRELVFPEYNDYLFYRIYCEKLGKKLISCN